MLACTVMLAGVADLDNSEKYLLAGGAIAVPGLVFGAIGPSRARKAERLKLVGAWYSPEEADALIDEHNAALPPAE